MSQYYAVLNSCIGRGGRARGLALLFAALPWSNQVNRTTKTHRFSGFFIHGVIRPLHTWASANYKPFCVIHQPGRSHGGPLGGLRMLLKRVQQLPMIFSMRAHSYILCVVLACCGCDNSSIRNELRLARDEARTALDEASRAREEAKAASQEASRIAKELSELRAQREEVKVALDATSKELLVLKMTAEEARRDANAAEAAALAAADQAKKASMGAAASASEAASKARDAEWDRQRAEWEAQAASRKADDAEWEASRIRRQQLLQ